MRRKRRHLSTMLLLDLATQCGVEDARSGSLYDEWPDPEDPEEWLRAYTDSQESLALARDAYYEAYHEELLLIRDGEWVVG